MTVLHIISTPDADLTYVTALKQRAGNSVSFLLLHEGVRAKPPSGFPVYAAREDCEARNVRPSGARLLSWGEIVDLLAAHERVLKW